MNLALELKFFTSALSDSSNPSIDENNPYRAGLLVEGFDDPIGVELLAVASKQHQDTELVLVSARTLNDTALLREGMEFFLTRGGKMSARGRITEIGK